MRATLEETLQETGILIIDGSMSTALELLGCNLNDSLWTAKVLIEQPELVCRVHYDYFCAGADCGITCSYQATIPGMMARGYSQEQAENMITRSVELFQEARAQWWQDAGQAQNRAWPLCLGAVGPYGAYLADGSEYRGNYGVSDEVLRTFHQRRMELLWNAGADLLLVETQPSFHEACIEADIAESMGANYWISFSCKDGKHTWEGDLIRDCASALEKDHPHLKMIGINCTAPQFTESLIHELRAGCSLPVAVYPNSGETYDPTTKTWHGSTAGLSFGAYAKRWMEAGALAVGGCCTTENSHIRSVTKARSMFLGDTPLHSILHR